MTKKLVMRTFFHTSNVTLNLCFHSLAKWNYIYVNLISIIHPWNKMDLLSCFQTNVILVLMIVMNLLSTLLVPFHTIGFEIFGLELEFLFTLLTYTMSIMWINPTIVWTMFLCIKMISMSLFLKCWICCLLFFVKLMFNSLQF